jgi:hypothetical protein
MEIEKEPSRNAFGRSGLGTGALVAALLTASLISVLYLGWKVAGLPFVPFDFFDWMTRILPGQVLAAGIAAMVTVIRTLNIGPTAATAKTAEHTMAIASIFFAGVIAGTILFCIIRALRGRYALTLGLGLGIALAVPLLWISYQVGQTASVDPGLSSGWLLGTVLLWGAILGWACRQVLPVTAPVVPVASRLAGEDAVERIGRRLTSRSLR